MSILDTPAPTPQPAAPLCPECVAGKHRNCLGDALDPETDEVTDCVCLHCI